MIFEIAAGVALGLMFSIHWREITSLGVLAVICFLLISLLGATCWTLYAGAQTVKNMPPLSAPNSAISTVISFFFGLIVNVLFAFACGQALKQRASLPGRSAYVFGALFYGLFLITAISFPIGIEAYLETEDRKVLLQFALLTLAWIFAIHQCFRFNRKRKQHDTVTAA